MAASELMYEAGYTCGHCSSSNQLSPKCEQVFTGKEGADSNLEA